MSFKSSRLIMVFTITACLAGRQACLVPTAACAASLMFDRGPDRTKRGTTASKSNTAVAAEQAFLAADYEDVVAIEASYAESHERINEELEYLAGVSLIKLKRYDKARDSFSKILNNGDTAKLLDKAYIGVADTYYLEGFYETAKEHYENMMRLFPDSDDMSIVFYRLADCHEKIGEPEAAKEYCQKILKNYPYSLEAKLLAGEKRGLGIYTVQVGAFSSWSNAKNLCDELKRNGFSAAIYTAMVADSRVYRVRVGQYTSADDARQMAAKLKSRGYTVKVYP